MEAYRESNNRGIVWFKRHKVIGYNGHCVIIDAELLNSRSACVYKTKSYPLPTGELESRETCVVCARSSVIRISAVEVHFAVDEIVVRRGSDKTGVGAHNSCKEGVILFMIPITESYWTKIDVVGNMLRTMHDERTPQTASILS